ncbi:L-fucose:H+ symporter permease [Chryseolinea lacunae]|uniref:L-fucose:H+ symporter permease n=1 Tax=Chryseolinea lacunae TaxID=2801331 RepID=A0ABS1L263_9BACT|nr:L-fucose:H+ symporter permease [Chryseolinea lacunae]MBL0745770.1 L-fucose:H+ symporter permease [Chryseolinea lacunae]
MPILIMPKASTKSRTSSSMLFPFILVTSLFFLWGLAYGLLDVLNKHFQNTLAVSKQNSMLLQAAYFGAYFLMALPAGIFMNRFGYRRGIVLGLLLYAVGAFLFYPSASAESFPLFLTSLFILASGLAFLETAANPYASVLGDEKLSTFRLNLAQSFNGVGSFLGPIIGAALFFGQPTKASDLSSVKFVYPVIGIIVLMVGVLFLIVKLPEIKQDAASGLNVKVLFSIRHFKYSVIAQFFYVAAQVGSAALFINYCVESREHMLEQDASYLLSAALLLFTLGRFVGTALMKVIKPHVLLSIFAAVNILLCVVIIYYHSSTGILALLITFFFNSIMFPTIFALGIKGLGEHTKSASSFLIMSIVGGAIVPIVMGSFGSTATAFWTPLCCFCVVLFFGTTGYKPVKLN